MTTVWHPNLPFNGQMTVPRELRIRNGRLCQWPVRELENCRRNGGSFHDVRITQWQSLPGVSGRVLDMTLHIRPAEGEAYHSFRVRVAEGGDLHSEISVRAQEGVVRMDRLNSGFPHDVVHVREFPAPVQKGELDLRIIMDKYSLELFAGEGECVASMTLYTPLSAEGIRFSADGAVLLDVEKYDISVEDK